MRTHPAVSAPRGAVLSPLAAALALALVPQAQAGFHLVTTAADSGGGSLRDAILAANAACSATADGAPTIAFSGAFTITPSTPLPAFSCLVTSYNPVVDASTYGATIVGPGGFANCGLEYQRNFSYGGTFTVKGVTVKGFNYGGIAAGICGSGLDIRGSSIHNNSAGIVVFGGAPANNIGGPALADRNLIYSNSVAGIELQGASANIENNWIGTSNGTSAAPNTFGIRSFGSPGQILGNVISGNSDVGILVYGDYGGSLISDNLIGVNAAGTGKLGNGGGGIQVNSSGGSPSIEFNVIGGNSVAGIDIFDSSGISITNNYIGTDEGGANLGNAVGIAAFCSGYSTIDGNTVGRNTSHGMNLQNTGGYNVGDNTIKDNGGAGIRLAGGADCVWSASQNDLDGNTITGNAYGIQMQASAFGSPVGNYITAGSIYGNSTKNVSLSGTTTLPNDPGDGDGGSNNQQNYPTITSVIQTGGVTQVNFTLDTSSGSTYLVQAWSNSAMGIPAGETFGGSTLLCGDCSETSGTIEIDGYVDNISLMATDTSSNDSSEFSPMMAAVTAPAVSVSPASVNFGNILVGTSSASRTVTLRSIGGQPWVAGDINSDGFCYGTPICYGGAFVCSTTCETDTSYTTGQSCTVTATFAPNFSGYQNTTIQFCDNTSSGSTEILLEGVGVPPPPITLTPRTWDFGGVPVGGTSETRTFTINNPFDYGGTIFLDLETLGEYEIVDENCGGSVSDGSSCQVTVAFAPTSAGDLPGELRVNYDSGGCEVALSATVSPARVCEGQVKAELTGVGLAGGTLAMPEAVNVGAAVFGGAGVSTNVTLTNNGNGPVNISSISIAGPFTLVNNCPATLAAGASCTLTVGFTAPGVGPFTGTLTVVSDGGSAEIPVLATGQTALSPLLRVQPVTMGFGDRLIGTLSPTQLVTITNIGGAEGTLGLLSTTIDFTIASTNCGGSLAAGASCTAQMAFRPLGFGPRAGSLLVTGNAPNSPQSVGLFGTGCRPFFATGNRFGEFNACAP